MQPNDTRRKEGDRLSRPTLHDIARRAEVSAWTVSQALRGSKSVGAQTSTRIREIAIELGYRPNQSARALVTSRTNMVAIWLDTHRDEFSEYYAICQYYLQQDALDRGYHCITEDRHRVRDYNREVRTNRLVDGVIACDVPGLQELQDMVDPGHHIPVVSIGSWGVDSKRDHVKIDLYPGSAAAVKHLLDVGCRRIAFVGQFPLDVRYDAYATVLREAGRQEEVIAFNGPNRPMARAALRSYIEAQGMPDALFCYNDDSAIGCYRALCDIGARIPDDVCIVGCDGIDDTEYLATPLSTITMPLKELSATAWTFLANRINDPSLPLQSHIIVPSLTIRTSSIR